LKTQKSKFSHFAASRTDRSDRHANFPLRTFANPLRPLRLKIVT
jgi:hypothetical protein